MSAARLPCLALVVLLPRVAAAAPPDPFLPDDTQAVASVQLRELRQAPAVKKYLGPDLEKWLGRGPAGSVAGLLRGLKVEPLQDIDRLTVAVTPDRFLLIARGRFDPAAVGSAAEKLARKEPDVLRIHGDGARSLYEYREPNGAVPAVFLRFLDGETAVASTSRDLVQQAAARKQPKISPELQVLLDRVDSKATVWLAGRVAPDWKKRLEVPPEYQRLADSLQSFHGAVTVGDDVRADFALQTNDPKAAVEIRKVAEGVKALLILAAANQNAKNGPVWADLLSALKVASADRAVTLRGQMTADQLDRSTQDSKKKP